MLSVSFHKKEGEAVLSKEVRAPSPLLPSLPSRALRAALSFTLSLTLTGKRPYSRKSYGGKRSSLFP
jgi:hypothetical protein